MEEEGECCMVCGLVNTHTGVTVRVQPSYEPVSQLSGTSDKEIP